MAGERARNHVYQQSGACDEKLQGKWAVNQAQSEDWTPYTNQPVNIGLHGSSEIQQSTSLSNRRMYLWYKDDYRTVCEYATSNFRFTFTQSEYKVMWFIACDFNEI